jgi:neutral ceramidase
MTSNLKAGASQVDISPKDSQFLFGYPHVKRYSTGIHERLWSSALYLSDGSEDVLFIANDIIFVGKEDAAKARKEISAKTGIKPENIMITATHTHSGPITVDYTSNQADPAVPKADPQYIALMVDGIIKAAVEAYSNSQPAKIGFAAADDTGVGTNRRDPSGPADHEVPVMLLKNARTNANIACMLVCSMHPTVMHEDSTLVSGDFPGMARLYLQQNVLGTDCPVLHHTGPAGNQSPRHVTAANTFEEAIRLGCILGRGVEKACKAMTFQDNVKLNAAVKLIDELPRKQFPGVEQARAALKNAVARLESLRKNNAPRQEVRTAECDWFGAEETLTLSKAAADGMLEQSYNRCLPAEIQAIKVGGWNFVGWQGEIFIEYALEVKQKAPESFVISLANGEMQGYIVTREAAEEGGYEASNALFSYQAGEVFVNETLKLLKAL